MKNSKFCSFDRSLGVAALFLLIFGILILASVSAVFSQEKRGDAGYFFFRQLLIGVIPGIVLGVFSFKINIAYLKKIALLALIINLLLMGLVFLPKIGVQAGGASRWINLGPASFQPSEFLKLTFILYLALWLASRTDKSNNRANLDWKFTFLPFLIILSIIALLLMLQSDLSTLIIIILAALAMYFSAKTPFWHSFLIIALIAGAIVLLIIFEPYRMERFLVFLGIKNDPMGIGYQVKQSLIAIGSGRVFGLGLGMSHQKIPQTMSDSIFSTLSEEMGFIGSSLLVALFVIFIWRGLRIAIKSSDYFSRLVAVGVSSWIGVQAFFNIGAMIGVLPLMGVPLPFISHGGSHIIAELVALGILLNISKSR